MDTKSSFVTSRTVNSRLWFVNNQKLEQHTLTFLAHYPEKHRIELYGFVLMGNHHHEVARFPGLNRSAFYRDLNARIAEGVRFFVDEFEGGSIFERRYSEKALPLDGDVEEQFFYCALQGVEDGLWSSYPLGTRYRRFRSKPSPNSPHRRKLPERRRR